MVLCLDLGNSQLFCGVYKNNEIVLRFRKRLGKGASSDEIGIFLRNAMIANNLDPDEVDEIAICSVVPDFNYSLINGCEKYFKKKPFFLKVGSKSGLKIKYKNPIEVGADRIATSIAGITRYPNEDLIIVDMGTAITFDTITKNKEYLGGAIVPGMRIAMNSLEEKTAKLPKVEILKTDVVCGRSTVESIQSGLYYGTLGTLKEITAGITKECFNNKPPFIIGTGGFASLFKDAGFFDEIYPNLVLEGIYKALEMNR